MTNQLHSRKRKRKIGSTIGAIVYILIALIYIGLGIAGVILKVSGGYSQDAGEYDTVTGTPAVALGIIYLLFGSFILAVVIAAHVGSKRKPHDYRNVARENGQDGENRDKIRRI